MPRSLHLLALGVALAASVPASSQDTPRRPRLAAAADSNDWVSYFHCAVRATQEREFDACVHWAHRLDPSRPEPLYLAYLMEPKKRDSLRTAAVYRDPFFYHARIVTVQEPKAGIFTQPSPERGWRALAAGNYYNAAVIFHAVLDRQPRLIDERWGLAIAQFYRRKYDSAATHLADVYADLARARDTTKLESVYRSLDFLSYMHAVALDSARQRGAAKQALQRALGENFAFHRAHAMLGDMALAEGDTAAADEAWRLTRDLVGDDADGRMRVARYLLRRGRHADAESELHTLRALEPYWPDVPLELARAIEAQGETRRADAARAWSDFLRIAPRAMAAQRALAEQRVRLLEGAR